jgi:oligopeptide transport system ATP-binding protein
MSLVLNLQNLQLSLGDNPVLRDVSMTLEQGECRALVGESGSGKSLTAMALLGLLPNGAKLSANAWTFTGKKMAALDAKQWRGLRGNDIAMIFQNPMSALNPTQKVGDQIAEPLRIHQGLSRAAAKKEAISLLERLAIPNPARRAEQYPFEYSGGMLQRAMIAMASACKPKLLIADEPTTALDVTVQAEVLGLLKELQQDRGMALLFITHDLGVVANVADSVSVMYAGQTIESGSLEAVFSREGHPYTAALKKAVPSLEHDQALFAIPGTPPDPRELPKGCSFGPRCDHRMAICEEEPALHRCSDGHLSRCWRWHPEHPLRWREGDYQ